MNLFKKNTLNEIEKKQLKQILYFYEMTKDIINYDYNTMSERNKKIIEIFDVLNYNNLPSIEENTNDLKTVYRGISAPDEETLNKYIYQFLYGDIFLGGRASIYGTGIYTCTTKNENTKSYATDGGLNSNGIILELKIPNDENVISYDKLIEIQASLMPRLIKMIDNTKFIELLENYGVLASILKYDAIYVEDKEYLVIMNRSKIKMDNKYVNSIINKQDDNNNQMKI